jgi:hypothetical protein
MNTIMILLAMTLAEPLDTQEAMATYKTVCGPKGRFTYAIEPNYRGSGVAISALFWGDVDRDRWQPGEHCAVTWALNMFGPILAEEISAEIQNLKWKVGETIIFFRGLLFRLKRDEEMAPNVGTWYLGVFDFAAAWRR